jgi:ribosomal protein L7/L12
MSSGDQISAEMRLAAIEEKLDRLLAHLGIDDDAGPGPAAPLTPADQGSRLAGIEGDVIVTLIQSGKKIQAIKAYRQATGVGLKDAKDAVEKIERNMRANGGWSQSPGSGA